MMVVEFTVSDLNQITKLPEGIHRNAGDICRMLPTWLMTPIVAMPV